METRQLERIILLILLLVNAVLLGLLLGDRVTEASAERAREEMLRQLLADSGIELAPDLDLGQVSPHGCTVVRDLELEDQRMQGILGEHVRADEGGGIWYYGSERGKIMMHGTGDLTILPLGETAERRGSAWEQSLALLRASGLEPWTPPGQDPTETDLPFCCCWNGSPVFNAVLTFSYAGDKLELVTGTTVFHRETARSPVRGMDAVSILTAFAAAVKNQGLICSRLTELTPGYEMSVGLSGESALEPVWRLVMDTGECYLSAETGQIVRLQV